MLQKNRQALILNGVSGEKYIIETIDYLLPHQIEDEASDFDNLEVFCPFCKNSVDNDSMFCQSCGNPIIDDLIKESDSFDLDL